MNGFSISSIALAMALAFSTGATAQRMSTDEHKAKKDAIAAEYKSAKAGCGALAGNAKDICMAEAKGKDRVATADLAARYKPTEKNHYQARVARAQADYSVARQKCDDQAGNAKDVCVQQAKAAQTSAKADAKAQMKAAEATQTAGKKSANARAEANADTAAARKEAAAKKRDAAYAVALEKCDAFAGDAKTGCVAKAKARHGRS